MPRDGGREPHAPSFAKQRKDKDFFYFFFLFATSLCVWRGLRGVWGARGWKEKKKGVRTSVPACVYTDRQTSIKQLLSPTRFYWVLTVN